MFKPYVLAILSTLLLSTGSRFGTASRVKVILMNSTVVSQVNPNSGPSLSVELPQYEIDQARGFLGNETQKPSNSRSQTYRQVSLASLTLHQAREQRSSSDRDVSDEPNQIDSLNNNLSINKTRDLQEIQLIRTKPSWLSVGRKFKITDSSIEEVKFSVPNEYLLRPAFDSPILLRTKLGIMEGVRSIQFNKFLYTFLSVPYARPPIGKFRFKEPEPVEPWIGVYQATKWPPFCVQPSMTLASKSSPVHIMSEIMTEDCLYMNIWTPSLKLSRSYRRPVMVWLHGGAFQYGGISVDENDASALALLGDVVVVTLNYRISAFGFLNANNKFNGPNNVGLLDQRMALKWVQANIKQFGGDPQQVTLFGESAGGHSVGLHLISPDSYNLFKRVIMQSGVPTSMLRSYDANSDNDGPLVSEGATMVAKRLGCLNEDNSTFTDELETKGGEEEEEEYDENKPILSDTVLECMRSKSSLEILKALGAPGSSGFFPTGNDRNGFFPNGPVMESFDPANLTIGPQVDFLIGTNMDEGTFMLHYGQPNIFPAREPPKVQNMEELRSLVLNDINKKMDNDHTEPNIPNKNFTISEIQSASGSSNGAHKHLFRPLMRLSSNILGKFMTSDDTNSTLDKRSQFGRTIGSLVTDIIFLCPSRSLAKTLAESGRNVFFYLYEHRAPNSQYHEWIGVTHHDEVEFVFGRPLRMADTYTGSDIEMSQRIIKAWSHFAKTGQMNDQLGVKWPKFGPEDNNFMRLNPKTASIGQRYHDKFCNLYDTVISVHLHDN